MRNAIELAERRRTAAGDGIIAAGDPVTASGQISDLGALRGGPAVRYRSMDEAR